MKKHLLLFTTLMLASVLVFAMTVPALAMPANNWEDHRDTGWNTNNDTLYISTADELAQLAYLVNHGDTFSGKTIILTDDIDLDDYEWTPIGSDFNYFAGVFDGNFYTINHLTIDTIYDVVGLFGKVQGVDAVVRNLSLKNVDIEGNKFIGGITGKLMEGSIENCSILSGSISGQSFIGSIAGIVIGNDELQGVVFGCINKAEISGTDNYIGGIVGCCDGGNIGNCLNYENISGNDFVGGITGFIQNNNKDIQLINCGNYGNIYGKNVIGGIAGFDSHAVLIMNCFNHGDVDGNDYVAGIIGTNDGLLLNCYNIGNITANISTNMGGIVGINRSDACIENCFSKEDCCDNLVGDNSGTIDDLYEFNSNGRLTNGDYLLDALNDFLEDFSFADYDEYIDLSYDQLLIDFADWSDRKFPEMDLTFSFGINENYIINTIYPLTQEKAAFTDIGSNQYASSIKYCATNGLLMGISNTLFAPNTAVNRAMVVTTLTRIDNINLSAYTKSNFTDTPINAWYGQSVAWAAQNNIVAGVSKTTFAPMQLVTKEQLAAILYRYAQSAGYDTSKRAALNGYYDTAKISDYAKDAMSWAMGNGMLGMQKIGYLQPQNNVTRAELALALQMFDEKIAN